MAQKHNFGNFLFVVFWWIVQRIHVQWARVLMYWGLRDGIFPVSDTPDPILGLDMWGRHFDLPIGISDGIDKKGNVLDSLLQMGYSFGSFGPYTLEKEIPPQDKYFFRADKAIITQCAGYRNPGLLKILPWLVKRRYLPHFVGVDLAIPAESEESNIKQERHFTYVEEFVLMTQRVAPYCDFITLDFSHPSSELCVLAVNSATILPILTAVKKAAAQAAPIRPPKIFVKIPLDLTNKEVPLIARTLLDGAVDGLVIAGPMSLMKNTHVKIKGIKDQQMAGMLIGQPTCEYTYELIRRFYTILKDNIPIIASGTINDAEAAFTYIAAGAHFIALDESCLLYEGPNILQNTSKELANLLKQRGFKSLADAIGSDSQDLEGKKSEDNNWSVPPKSSNFTSTPSNNAS